MLGLGVLGLTNGIKLFSCAKIRSSKSCWRSTHDLLTEVDEQIVKPFPAFLRCAFSHLFSCSAAHGFNMHNTVILKSEAHSRGVICGVKIGQADIEKVC